MECPAYTEPNVHVSLKPDLAGAVALLVSWEALVRCLISTSDRFELEASSL